MISGRSDVFHEVRNDFLNFPSWVIKQIREALICKRLRLIRIPTFQVKSETFPAGSLKEFGRLHPAHSSYGFPE